MQINGTELMAEIGRSRETAQGILSNGLFIRDAHERAPRIDYCGNVAIDERANGTCQISDEHLLGNRIRWVIRMFK